MDLSLFRHQTEIYIRYGDIDMLRHVNNAKYMTFMEQARVQYAFDVFGWDGNWDTLNMILARVEVDFRQPIFIQDRLVIYSRVARLGNKSFDMEYLFVRKNADAITDIAAKAQAVLVAYDTALQKSKVIPDEMRQRILNFEKDLN